MKSENPPSLFLLRIFWMLPACRAPYILSKLERVKKGEALSADQHVIIILLESRLALTPFTFNQN